jgi:2-iminobutanoate/2-iminopropanoate deaminase
MSSLRRQRARLGSGYALGKLLRSAYWKFESIPPTGTFSPRSIRNAFARDAGLRIDHLLLSPPLAERLISAGVDRDLRGREHASDHAPAWDILRYRRIANVNIRHSPASVAAPFRPYSHAIEVPEGSRLPYISGEVGVLPDGTPPENIEAQAEACWQNIIAILADAGMDVEDLVKITTFLVRPEDVAAAGAARAKHFADARPGSATIIVKALVNPAWLIEIEAVAAARRR